MCGSTSVMKHAAVAIEFADIAWISFCLCLMLGGADLKVCIDPTPELSLHHDPFSP
jgi:hypothetical protein